MDFSRRLAAPYKKRSLRLGYHPIAERTSCELATNFRVTNSLDGYRHYHPHYFSPYGRYTYQTSKNDCTDQ